MNYSINESRLNKANKLFEQLESKQKSGKGTFVEYTKKVENKTFGIVKESTLYTIKVCDNKTGTLVAEDFSYIDGFGNRKRFQRDTLQEAIKYLHLYLNEDKYVLDIPVVNAGQPEMPEGGLDGEMEDKEKMDPEMGDEMEMDGDSEMEDSDSEEGADDSEMEDVDSEEGAEGDDDPLKDMQSMTGKLTQELRSQISAGKGTTTVGIFKSILAAGKNLETKDKEEVLDKAEDVLKADDKAESLDEANRRDGILSNYGLSIFKKDKLFGIKDEEGTVVVPAKYLKIDGLISYDGTIDVLTAEGKTKQINILDILGIYDDEEEEDDMLYESMLEDHGLEVFEKNGLKGLMDEEGNVVLSPKYSYIDDVINPNGLMMVKTADGTKIKIDIFSYMD
jgi:hypothetical protein